MKDYELLANEVVLYKSDIIASTTKGYLQLTLTSEKIVLEKQKGLFKKEAELIDLIPLDSIKVYNNKPQIEQKRSTVIIQIIDKIVTLTFNNILESKKFTSKIIDSITKTTIVERRANIIKRCL